MTVVNLSASKGRRGFLFVKASPELVLVGNMITILKTTRTARTLPQVAVGAG
jgi:hypothetical protein